MFFFFSSRRRHTRLTCDWSSDVCSSDLGTGAIFLSGNDNIIHDNVLISSTWIHTVNTSWLADIQVGGSRNNVHDNTVQLTGRSEERRVGKSVDLGGRRSSKTKKTRNNGR